MPPTLDSLASVLPAYGARFDVSLGEARQLIGPHCDPSNRKHAEVLRVWLNAWLCRIRVPVEGEADPFVDELADWWTVAEPHLPASTTTLAQVSDSQIGGIADVYGQLEGRTAAVKRNGQVRTFAPTATAKILYFVRPLSVTAWDNKISRHVAGHGSAAFRDHLLVCRSWAQALIAEATKRGLAEDEIGRLLDRRDSSVAKLIDEWLYRTITGGVDPGVAEAH